MIAAFPRPAFEFQRPLRNVLLLGVLGVVGVAAAWQPMVALLAPLALYAALRRELLFRDMVAFLVVGSMILTYGFANLGVRLGGIPLPLTEMLLGPVLLWVLVSRRPFEGLGISGVLLIAFVGLAGLHLILDFPVHGTLALRDFTTPLEALFFIVGYWAYRTYGLAWCNRLWLIGFLGVACYGLLLPWHTLLAETGPTVGLQQPVPLFDIDVGLGPAIAAGLFFFLLRVRGPVAFLLAALCLGEIAMIQMRGLYLAVPAVLMMTLVASGRLRSGVTSRLAGAVAVAAVGMVLLLPYAPEGRVGQVNASVLIEQMSTLLGKKGAGDTSFEDRADWYKDAWADQTESFEHLVWGVGLGDDLARGFAVTEVLVRKPHNDYIEVFARFGLLGLTLWGGFLASILLPIWRKARSPGLPGEQRSFLLWVLAAASVYLLISATQPLLAFPYGTIPLFTLLGMGLAAARAAGPASSEDAGAPQAAQA